MGTNYQPRPGIAKPVPIGELSANRPVLSGFVRKSSANVHEFSNSRTFDVKLLIIFESNLPTGEWDNGLINASVRAKIAEIAQEWLIYEYSGWKIRVKVR